MSIHILDVGQCPDSRAGRADEVLNVLDIVLDNVEDGLTIWLTFSKFGINNSTVQQYKVGR